MYNLGLKRENAKFIYILVTFVEDTLVNLCKIWMELVAYKILGC